MNGDLKQTFVLQAVQEYMKNCSEQMAAMIRRKKAIKTEEGLRSIVQRVRENGAGATGELLFKEYLRMVDMGAGRGHPLGGLAATRVNIARRNIAGQAYVRDKIRKPKKIYASVVYGRLNYLYNKLLYGYTEAVIASLKQMENGAGNSNP